MNKIDKIFLLILFSFLFFIPIKVEATKAICKYSTTGGTFTITAENGQVKTDFSASSQAGGAATGKSKPLSYSLFLKNSDGCELECPIMYIGVYGDGRSVNYTLSNSKENNFFVESKPGNNSAVNNDDCTNENAHNNKILHTCQYSGGGNMDVKVDVYADKAVAYIMSSSQSIGVEGFENGCKDTIYYACYNDNCRVSSTAVSGMTAINYEGNINRTPVNEESGKSEISSTTIPTGDPMTCNSLKGTDTYKIIQQIFKWLQIAAPIMLVIFGIMDFSKAVASGDNDAIKKAQQTFVKRIIIVAIILLLPLIMELLFSLLDGALGNDISTCDINK